MDQQPTDSTSAGKNAAGWRPDPYGRAQHRYYDGERWTASIATNGVATTDPLGVTASIPFSMPPGLTGPPTEAPVSAATSGAPGAPGAVAGSGSSPGFLASMGPRATARPAPTLRGSFGAAGGVILTGGLLALVLANDVVSSTTAGVIGATLILASGFAMSRTKPVDFDFRAACIAMTAIGILTFSTAVTSSNGGTSTLLIAAALMLIAWVAPPFRGTPLFLGGGTLTLVVGLAIAVGESAGGSRFGNAGFGGMAVFGEWLPQTRSAGIFLLVATAVLTIVVRRVDAAGYHGISAPLLVAALFAAVVGVVAAGLTFDDSATYVLAALAGALLAYVGARGGHRATTWSGAILAGAGSIAAVLAGTTPSSPRIGGVIALLVGAALIVGPRLAAMIGASNASSDQQPPVPEPSIDGERGDVSGGSGARP